MTKKSQKVLDWTAKNYVISVIVFILCFASVFGLFLVAEKFNCGGEKLTDLNWLLTIGITIFLVCSVLFFCLFFDRRNFMKKAENIVMVFLIIIATLVVCFVVERLEYTYARPVALAALLAVLLIDRRSAIVINTAVCLLMFLSDTMLHTTQPFENSPLILAIVGFSSGVLGIYVVDGMASRIRVILSGLVISIPAVLFVPLIVIKLEGKEISMLIQAIVSGCMSVVLFSAILPLFEMLFSKLTDFRLSELTSNNAKIIKEMIVKAPGSFNHSLVLASLAESCAISIGENPLLARACAYYHDVGKLRKPEYFVENNSKNNLHQDLSPEVSVSIIRAHAIDGYNLLKRYHIPEEIAVVAKSHHGTLPIKFFYAKAKKLTDGEVDIKDFSYPGPKPQTKMAAIIMICDAAEASVRVLADRTPEKVTSLIDEIVKERIDFGQFDECEITMNELTLIKNSIIANVSKVFHDRIVYPKIKLSRKRIKV